MKRDAVQQAGRWSARRGMADGRIRIAVAACGLLAAAACHNSTGPGSAAGDRWALVSIDAVGLPAQPAAFSYTVLADTLEFDVSSTQWTTRPLARARRAVRYADGSAGTEDWWYTYDAGEALPTTFAFRALCADGDSAASCIDGSADAMMDSSGLTISFRESGLGVLRYRRVE